MPEGADFRTWAARHVTSIGTTAAGTLLVSKAFLPFALDRLAEGAVLGIVIAVGAVTKRLYRK